MEKNNKSPFFSIVLSIYGVEKYLNRCINSFINQKFEDYEIILVDDGSKDKCPEMCDEWAKKDSRIKVVHKLNAGLGMARNTGLETAKGKYIFFIDSDDYVLDGLLEETYKAIEKYHTDIIFYGFCRVNEKGEIVQNNIPQPDKMLFTNHEEIKNMLFPEFLSTNPRTGISQKLRISAWNCCISVEFLKRNNLKFVSEREYICEDVYFYIEMFPHLQSVYFLPEVYYCYCQNVGSLTFTYRADRYQRIKHFYTSAAKLMAETGHCEDAKNRLNAQLFSNVLGCMKMEAANKQCTSFWKKKNRIKEIAGDPYILNSIKQYKNGPKSWKLYYFLIEHRMYFVLTFLLLVQYHKKGI